MPDRSDLDRIQAALLAAKDVLAAFTPGAIEAKKKAGDDPVTAADTAVDDALKRLLPRDGEGWLSEETVDDERRLSCRRVWVVDPLDGTRELVEGIPEWCVSVGLVEDGEAVAGGIVAPMTDEIIVGGRGLGVRRNGFEVAPTSRAALEGALVLGSRSESKRGEWDRFQGRGFTVQPMGSVAYKLALVAAGRADATWTLVPKNEWDVAAGVALIAAGGGFVAVHDPAKGTWEAPRFNQRRTSLWPGMAASGGALGPAVRALLST